MLRPTLLIITTAALCLSVTVALAEVPQSMNVQGRLTDNAGDPVPAGFKSLTFSIYDSEIGGAKIWPAGPGETQAILTDANGLWNANVGAVIPLTDDVFADSTRWLELTVNDGVNPPETLSRIKLTKTPFTSDQYVNTTGDTLTGQLFDSWTHAADGKPSIAVQNESGQDWEWGATVSMGIGSIVSSNGTESKMALAGLADGDDGVVVGLYASAHGLSGFRYSGFFDDGDFVVMNPTSIGSSSVQLPPDAISSEEILDEPGIAAQRYAGADIPLTPSNTSQDFLSVTITTPAPGYIVVEGVANMRMLGDGDAFTWCQINDISNATRLGGHSIWGGSTLYANSSGGESYITTPVRRVFVADEGTFTYYLQGNEYEVNNPAAAATVLSPTWLQATYYPTSYGTVSTVASHSEASEFSAAIPVAPQSAPLGRVSKAETSYLVDLRELEIKYKNAELAAERARREYTEARLKLEQSAQVDNTDR